MEILGIGPGEFLLILVVLLVAVGPERLPGLARQAGRLLVRGRNWLQSSPDAALILRARQELDQELAAIRASLLEVQTVRDEVLGAAKQIGDSVGSLASTKIPLDDVGTIAPPAASPAAGPEVEVPPPAPAAPADSSLPADAAASEPSAMVAPSEPIMPQIKLDQWSVAREPAPPAPPAEPHPANGAPAAAPTHEQAQVAFESIELRLQAIMADLHALQEQLRQRGALAEDWRPPSWEIQMPGRSNADSGAAGPAAPIETEEAAR